MEDATRDVPFREDGDLVRELYLFERRDELEVGTAVRLRHALQLPHDERGDDGAILRHLMLPPAYRQVAPERLAVIEVGADDRCLKIDALLHDCPDTIAGLPRKSSCGVTRGSGSRRMTPRVKSNVTR